MDTLLKTTSFFALAVVVGCACGGDKDVKGDGREAAGVPGDFKPDVSVTTVGGEYELVVSHEKDLAYAYELPSRDVVYGPIYYEFSSPARAFVLEKPEVIYVHTSAGMSYGDLLEISLENKTVKRLDHCVALIGYSPDGAWIAYNRMYDLTEELNPGENWDACSMYVAPYDIEEEGPRYIGNPPIGSYVYFQYTGETKPLFTVAASSALKEPGKPGDSFGPGKLIDGTRSTAWAEGAGGRGEGEWVEFTASAPVSIHGIRVWGGYAESPATMGGNAHPVKMSVILDGDNEAGYVEFPPAGGSEYSDYVGEWRASPDGENTARAETVRLTVEEVAPGTRWDDCCISEIEVW
jgi:hypothetical protein